MLTGASPEDPRQHDRDDGSGECQGDNSDSGAAPHHPRHSFAQALIACGHLVCGRVGGLQSGHRGAVIQVHVGLRPCLRTDGLSDSLEPPPGEWAGQFEASGFVNQDVVVKLGAAERADAANVIRARRNR